MELKPNEASYILKNLKFAKTIGHSEENIKKDLEYKLERWLNDPTRPLATWEKEQLK